LIFSRSTRSKKDGDDLNDIIRDICEDDGFEIPSPVSDVRGLNHFHSMNMKSLLRDQTYVTTL